MLEADAGGARNKKQKQSIAPRAKPDSQIQTISEEYMTKRMQNKVVLVIGAGSCGPGIGNGKADDQSGASAEFA